MAGGSGTGTTGNGTAQNLTFGSVAICGISSSFIIFATGLACLIVAVFRIFEARDVYGQNKKACGQQGHPPLAKWIFGAGISFLIITCAFCRVSSGKAGNCAKLILAVSNLFIMIWAIVGAVSLWVKGEDCRTLDPTLYRMGYAAVILSFGVCCCGGFVGYTQHTIPEADAVIVVEDNVTAEDAEKDIEAAVPVATGEQQSSATAVPMASKVTEVADA